MKEIHIESPKKCNFFAFIETIQKSCESLIIYINFILIIYLLIYNKRTTLLNKEKAENYSLQKRDSIIDKDMVGLKYPEIQFNEIKSNYIDGHKLPSFLDLLEQLEIKLIYLEKEINVTKLISFFTARKLYLKDKNVTYDDSRIKKFHDIINWLIIHKSTQLKGIASDKYLACKYVEMKLGKNLCPHRIEVYDRIEDIDFEKLAKKGNFILKISNGNRDNVEIKKNTTRKYIDKIKKRITFHFNRNYPLKVPSLFHLYSKKRIILEKMFVPLTDLYEFKFYIINRDIKMILLKLFKKKAEYNLYNENFVLIKNYSSIYSIDSLFKHNILKKMKDYAYKLSEDFPNFIRVDLYIFHKKIYLSELTFDAHDGLPQYNDINYFKEGVKSWKRIDN